MPGLYSVTARVSWEGRVLFKLGASIWKRLGIESAGMEHRVCAWIYHELTTSLGNPWVSSAKGSSIILVSWFLAHACQTKDRTCLSKCVGVCVCLCLAIFYPSIYLPIIIYPSTSSHLSIPIHPYIHLSTHYPSIHRSIYPSIDLSIYLSISLSVSIHLSIHLSIYLSISLSLYPFISLTSISLSLYLPI